MSYEEKILEIIDENPVNFKKLAAIISQRGFGANTTLQDYGSSMLIYAVDQNKQDVIEWLLQHGALIEKHFQEKTPLFIAAESGDCATVDNLLRHGSNITGEFYFNCETALTVSAFKFCEQFIGCLEKMEPYDGFNSKDIDLILRILNHWDDVHSKSPWGVWQSFGLEKSLTYEYAYDCLQLYLRLKRCFLLDGATIETDAYARIYQNIFQKEKILRKKAPSKELDEYETDYESDIEKPYVIKSVGSDKNQEQRLTSVELQRYISDLNKELESCKENDIDWEKYPKFFVAQYRGIHYYRHHFTKAQRSDHRHTSHLNRIAPAPAVYYMLDEKLKPLQHQLARESEVKEKSEKIKEVFDDLQASKETDQYWPGNKRKFKNDSDMIQQRMSNSYDTFGKDVIGQKHPFMKKLYDEKIIGYPHYATSDLPYHALRYGYGQKKIDSLKEWRLRPVFQGNGRPLHPYPGKIFLSLFTPVTLSSHRARHVAGMHNRGDIALLGTVAPERETSMPGGLQPDIVFHEELLVIPSFEEYDESYDSRFGITFENFQRFQLKIKESLTVTSDDEKTNLRKKIKNEIIDTIILHFSKKMVFIAEEEAKNRGGYLIYKYCDGVYGLSPEAMRIPSREPEFFPKYEREILDKKQKKDDKLSVQQSRKRGASEGGGFLDDRVGGHDEKRPKIKEPLRNATQILKEIDGKIQDAFKLGVAVSNGDCFFDSIAQSLNAKESGETYTVKSLRILCDAYVKIEEHPWVKEAVEKDKSNYQEYLARVLFTADEMEEHDRLRTLKGTVIWGRPEIEGRMICDKLGIQLHIIEVPEENQVVDGVSVLEQLVDKDGSKSIGSLDKERYRNDGMIHLVVHHNHFVNLVDTAIVRPAMSPF